MIYYFLAKIGQEKGEKMKKTLVKKIVERNNICLYDTKEGGTNEQCFGCGKNKCCK